MGSEDRLRLARSAPLGTTKTGAKMQERACRTRRAILQAAAESFESQGYLGTSLQGIVTRKDISKGALYFHFGSKEALAQEVVKEQQELWTSEASILRATYPRAVRVILELTWCVARMNRDNALMRAGIRLLAERNLADPSTPHPFAGLARIIEELFVEAQAQHDLLPDVDVGMAATLVSAAIAGIQQGAIPAGKRSARKAVPDRPGCVTAMWRYILPGLVTADCLADMSVVSAELIRTPQPDVADWPQASYR